MNYVYDSLHNIIEIYMCKVNLVIYTCSKEWFTKKNVSAPVSTKFIMLEYEKSTFANSIYLLKVVTAEV